MGCKAFTDANILLDLALKREHYETARQIIESAISGNAQLFVTPSVVHIVSYYLTKELGKVKTRELMLSFLDNITVIDATHEVTLNALYSRMDDIEDALQYFAALHFKLDYFITRDKQLARQALPGLPVVTPEYFVNKVL